MEVIFPTYLVWPSERYYLLMLYRPEGQSLRTEAIRSHPIQFYSRMVSKRTSKWLWNGISNYHIAKSYFSLYYTPSSPIRVCGQVDKQVRTKTPYWIYREFPRDSRIEKSSPVPLGCPSERYYLGSHFLDPLFWSFIMALFASKNIRAPETLACVQTSPLPHKKSVEVTIFSAGGGTSVHRLRKRLHCRLLYIQLYHDVRL